jgi:hypothetical protein
MDQSTVAATSLVILLIVRVEVGVGTDTYTCGQCVCLPELLSINCYGHEVIQFPDLDFNEKTYAEYIQIVDTLMFCLPPIEPDEFRYLKGVQILNNVYLQCSCIQQWQDILTDIHFVTDRACDLTTSAFPDPPSTSELTSEFTPSGINTTVNSLQTTHLSPSPLPPTHVALISVGMTLFFCILITGGCIITSRMLQIRRYSRTHHSSNIYNDPNAEVLYVTNFAYEGEDEIVNGE